LRSRRTEFMLRVAFIYPEDAMAKWDEIKKNDARNHSRQILPGTGEYLGDLNFDYTIDGAHAAWKPLRVYNDGVKTIIQMHAAMSQSEAPILLVVRKDGGLFTDEESVQVNCRLQGNRYIVDSIWTTPSWSRAWVPARSASPFSEGNKNAHPLCRLSMRMPWRLCIPALDQGQSLCRP
jgi:type IV secretion system protein VirB9